MEMEFSCPTCNLLLQKQKLEGIRLRKCESCRGFAISLPIVRNGLGSEAFKKIWQQLFSGEIKTGRPCPGCKDPLSVVEADGQGGVIMIDVCRTCQILWFDDNEFSDLPKVDLKVEQENQSESRLLTPEELTFSAFKEDQYQRRSFLFKLMDGSVADELELNRFFGDFFDE
jgi:Zn-finger nucleic acid-binding protein